MIIETVVGDFAVCKVRDYSEVNPYAEFVFTGRTDEENSLVCRVEDVPKNALAVEKEWKTMRICGTLDFSLVGVLSGILGLLAAEKISVFAVSTYNTDYVFVKSESFDAALNALERAGHTVIRRS